MPALPSNKSRRKGVTPIKKPNQDDVWQRTLAIMGLEPLSSSSNTSVNKAVAAEASTATADPGGMAAPTPAPELTQGSKKKLTILDLPIEAQKDIFKHTSPTDVLALCLVSKHFRDLAAERLYRKFEVTFPDEPDDGPNPSADVLAGGLETLVASEYDYAKYLRDIVLEPMNSGDKGERAYRYYMCDSSCGKFMNTLFLLALRKAKALETFKWDIRVELSRPVFKALHQVRALQNLHIRMQAGHSMYYNSPTSGGLHYVDTTPIVMMPPPPPPGAPMGPPPGFGPPPHNPPSLSVTYPSGSINLYPSGIKYAAKLQQNTTKAILPTIKEAPPTLAGFKHLKTLAILDMDTLDYVSELRTCIRNCSSTLSSLTLSFSEPLANKSRKPPPEVHSDDDSEVEDEFGQMTGIPPPGPPPPGMASSSDPNAPTKALKAQEEKKKQDDVLYRIFGLHTGKWAKSIPPTKPDSDATPPKLKSDKDQKLGFLRNIASIAQKLMQSVKPGSDDTPEAKKALELIRTAAKMCMEELDKAKEKSSQSENSSKETPDSSTTSGDNASEDNVEMSGGAEGDDEPGLFDDDAKKKSVPEKDPDDANPDDIDIEEPEGKELQIDFDGPSTDAEPADESLKETSDLKGLASLDDASTSVAKELAKNELAEELPEDLAPKAVSPEGMVELLNRLNLQDQIKALITKHSDIREEELKLRQRMAQLQTKMDLTNPTPQDLQTLNEAEAEFRKVSLRLTELSVNMNALSELVDDVGADAELVALQRSVGNDEAKMSEYVRTTRGLTLKSLAIYLIPVRAGVLSSAIDLAVLQSITLLNVGAQVGIWNLFYKENKTSPLPLTKIYTDNVTMPFLQCVAELEKVTELLLLEKHKGRVESTAAKTTVTMEHIRRAILKKHAPTLKVLMIKHDSNSDWDLNVKTTMLLCHRAKALEELSVSFGVKTMHCLLQHIPLLPSLRALHTNHFRTDDTCMWVMREFKRFAIDNVAHNPGMKLEYLALQDNVDRLVRRKPSASTSTFASGKAKGKGKGKGKAKDLAELVLGVNAALGGEGSGSSVYDWAASSEDEGDGDSGMGFVGKAGLKVEAVEGVRFGDVSGVRIFERDVVGGRL